MAQKDRGWLDRYVDSLPERGWFKFLSTHVVLPYWVWREGKPKLPGGPRPSPQPSENTQRMMNLVMPLKDSSAIGKAKVAMVIAHHSDEIFAGVDNVGTVHFARFLLIGDSLCMISVYDGDFSNYIRDFIATIGSMFDDLMLLVKDGNEVYPAEQHIEKFIDWVHERDLFQVPDFPTDLFDLQDAAQGLPPGSQKHELRSLSRAMILQFHANPNVSLGGGYRCYPGLSAAQVRRQLGVGW